MYCSEDYSVSCIWGQQNKYYGPGPSYPDYCSNGEFWVGMYYEYYEFFQKCKNAQSICNVYPIITQPPSFQPTSLTFDTLRWHLKMTSLIYDIISEQAPP
eukprot:183566_1